MRNILTVFLTLVLTSCDANAYDPAKYDQDAILVLAYGSVINGAEDINKQLAKLGITEVSREIIFSTRANNSYDYRISTIKSGDKAYNFITVAQSGNEGQIVFEVVAEVESSNTSRESIDRRRREWVELCNKHNSGELVKGLYSENPIYYNHKPPVTSQEALTNEYSYMNNPNYSLDLEPLHLEMVSANLAFEIGQCSGSYGGKYIIVWEKNSHGKWVVKVDSNI